MLNPWCSRTKNFNLSESWFPPGKEVEIGSNRRCVGNCGTFVGNYKIAAKLYCRLTRKRLTDVIATLTKHYFKLRTFTSTIKSRKCYIKVRPMKFENFD